MAKIKPLGLQELAKIKNRFSPFVKEVRKKILHTFLFFIASAMTGFVFYERIIKFLVGLLPFEGINIVFTSPFQFVNLAFSCGLAVGLVVTLPLFTFQVLSFLKPALKKNEYRALVKFLPFVFLLFLTGLGFGAVVMRWQIKASLAQSAALGIGNMLDISKLISTILLTATLMGLGFEFPVVLLLLMRLEIIDSQQLSSKRLWVYLGSFIFTLFLPLDSILADFFLTLPLIFLFELSLILNRVFKKS